jgi:DNA-binding MarR family transcriptional regulator
VETRTSLSFDAIAEARRHWVERDWEAADAMAAATSIMRAQQIVQARVDDALKPFGLTFARYEALALLHLSRKGALPIGKMGARLMVHPTSVTNAVGRLEEQGFVRRTGDPDDRRTVLAQITPPGRRIVERATTALGSRRFGLQGLADADARRITSLVRRLREQAGDFPRRGRLNT